MVRRKIIQLTGLAVMSVLVISACGKSVKTMSTISISRYETSPEEETETTDINESVTDTHNTETPGVNETNTINEATAPPKIARLETEEEETYNFDYTLPNTFEQPTAKEKPDEVSYIKGMYNSELSWDGKDHKKSVDDGKELSDREMLISALSGRHSFTYRRLKTEDSNSLYIYDNKQINMAELRYILSIYGYELNDFTMVDMDGDGLKEAVIRCEYGIHRLCMIFYVQGGNVYMTAFEERSMPCIFKTSGEFTAPDGSISRMKFTTENVDIQKTVTYDIDDNGEVIYYINGDNVSESEYDHFCDEWESSGTDCEFVRLTAENINKYQ